MMRKEGIDRRWRESWEIEGGVDRELVGGGGGGVNDERHELGMCADGGERETRMQVDRSDGTVLDSQDGEIRVPG